MVSSIEEYGFLDMNKIIGYYARFKISKYSNTMNLEQQNKMVKKDLVRRGIILYY